MMATTAKALVGQAERALLLSDFCTAEAVAREACKLTAGKAEDGDTLDRACVVAVQCLYETQRFGLAHRLLRDTFGTLPAAPPHTLLLWLALALDSPDHRREAERLIQELLDTKQPSTSTSTSSSSSGTDSISSDGSNPNTGGGWSRRQFLALVHLYTEVLLRELREPAAVMRWVQETQLPINAEERQLLLDELEAEQHQQQQQQRHSPRSGGAAAGEGRGGGAAARGAEGLAAATARQWGGGRAEEEAGEGRSFQQDMPTQASTRNQDQVGSSSSGRLVTKRRPAAAGSEIEPAVSEGEQQGGMAMGWLGRCQVQVLHGASAVLAPLLGMSPQQLLHGLVVAEEPGDSAGKPAAAAGDRAALALQPHPAAAVRQLSRTVLGCVLLYAAYAERRAIKRSMGAAQRFVSGGTADLLRMAFSLSVNPMSQVGS
ncbi:hypothetical protein ACK3TF_004722 [Chlorella vulgaris]